MKQSGHRGSLDGQSLGRVALWSATAVAVWFGWRVFWFLTDDSIIAELLFLMGQYRHSKAIFVPRQEEMRDGN